jgi:hypothetical protein
MEFVPILGFGGIKVVKYVLYLTTTTGGCSSGGG